MTKPTSKGKTVIDHICSNIPNKLIHGDIIYTDEISDHDCSYTIFNIRKERFEPRYKYIRIEKNLNMNNYISNFKNPTNLVYAFDEPDDQIDVLNNLANQCIVDHAPTKKVKFTRPLGPWMTHPEIISPKNHLKNLRNTSRDSNHYQAARNNYKKIIRSKKATFLQKARSSKNPKEVRETVNRILDQLKNQIKHDAGDLNRYYTELASTLTNKGNIDFDQMSLANILLELEKSNTFVVQHMIYTEVKNITVPVDQVQQKARLLELYSP